MKKRHKIIWGIAGIALAGVFLFVATGNIQALRGSTFVNSLPDGLRKAGKNTSLYIKDAPSMIKTAFQNKKLPTINLIMKPTDIDALNTIDSDDAYQTRGKVWRDAEVEFEGQTYKARARLRGDTSSHWAYTKKSWRIELKKNKTILGHKVFNLIVPEDRLYVMEWLNNERAKSMNLLVPDAQFVALTLNQKKMGPYVLFEQVSDDFIFNHDLPEDTVIFGEDGVNEPIFSNAGYWSIKAGDPNTSYKQLETLLEILNEPSDEIYYRKLKQIVDTENLATWHAHSILAGSNHQDWAHNMRIYYSPAEGKLKFMPWDVLFDELHRENMIDRKYNPILDRLANIKEYQIMRGKILWETVASQKWKQDDRTNFEHAITLMRPALFWDRAKEPTNNAIEQEFSNYTRLRETNIDAIKNELQEFKVYASANWNVRNTIAEIKITTQSGAPYKIIEWSTDGNFSIFNEAEKRVHQPDIMAQKIIRENHLLYTTFKTEPQTYTFTMRFNRPQTERHHITLTLQNLISQKLHELPITSVGY